MIAISFPAGGQHGLRSEDTELALGRVVLALIAEHWMRHAAVVAVAHYRCPPFNWCLAVSWLTRWRLMPSCFPDFSLIETVDHKIPDFG